MTGGDNLNRVVDHLSFVEAVHRDAVGIVALRGHLDMVLADDDSITAFDIHAPTPGGAVAA